MTVCGERRRCCFTLHIHNYPHEYLILLQQPLFSFSLNLAHFGVKVLCIEPGFFKTNVTDTAMLKKDLKRLWDRLPEEVKESYGPGFLQLCEFKLYLCKRIQLYYIYIYLCVYFIVLPLF